MPTISLGVRCTPLSMGLTFVVTTTFRAICFNLVNVSTITGRIVVCIHFPFFDVSVYCQPFCWIS